MKTQRYSSPETLVTNEQSTPREFPEQRRSHLYRGISLKSHIRLADTCILGPADLHVVTGKRLTGDWWGFVLRTFSAFLLPCWSDFARNVAKKGDNKHYRRINGSRLITVEDTPNRSHPKLCKYQNPKHYGGRKMYQNKNTLTTPETWIKDQLYL